MEHVRHAHADDSADAREAVGHQPNNSAIPKTREICGGYRI